MSLPSEPIRPAIKKIDWVVTLFFIFTGVVGIPGAIWYGMTYGISASEIWLAVFFAIVTSMSITMGYHRCFAHVTYKAHPVVQFFLLFFGAASFQQSALEWASQHRVHHQYTDTDLDPYSIKKGFWYAHIGWLTSYTHFTNYDNVKDLQRSRLMMSQHNHYKLWAIGAGVVFPVLIGSLMGHALGAFILAVCARVTLIYQTTFCINSVCHMFGTATYDIHSSAKDHWFAAILTSGEGYHNFHHHFPGDYRNGVRWYHWDPTKWAIAILAGLGLASDLKRIPKYRIIAARMRAKHLRAEEALLTLNNHPMLSHLQQALKDNYERVKHTLAEWEHHAIEYRDAVRKKIHDSNQHSREALRERVSASKKQFKLTQAEWESFYSNILQLQAA